MMNGNANIGYFSQIVLRPNTFYCQKLPFLTDNEYSVFVDPINDDPTFSELNYCKNPEEFLKRKVEVRNYFLSLEKDYSEAFKILVFKSFF